MMGLNTIAYRGSPTYAVFTTKDHTTHRLCMQAREDLKELGHHEPARRMEIMAKLQTINNILRDKLARARHLLYCIENGCIICHPDNGVSFE